MKKTEEQHVEETTAIALSQPRSISRRGLLRAAASAVTMGAIQLLPLIEVPGQEEPVAGFLRSKTALAAEESFVITIVSKTEIGINVVDIANNNEPVEGATVTITSRFPKAKVKSRSAVTGEDFDDPEDRGKVIIDIADLAETDDDGNPLNGRYEFNGSISVKRAEARGVTAMRDFSTGLMRIKGATALEVSTHEMDELQIYPERITFNDWDMHYTVPTFWRSAVNSEKQTILIRFAGCSGDVDVSISDHEVGNWPRTTKGELTAKATYDDESGYYVAKFEGRFLCTDKSKNENLGILDDKLKIDFAYTYGDTTYHTYQELCTKEAPIDTVTEVDSIDPLSLAVDSFDFPKDWPFIGGAKIGLKTPDIPFRISASPTRVTLGVNLGDSLLKKDNGQPKTQPQEIEMDPIGEIEDEADDERASEQADTENAIANKDVGMGGSDGPSGKKSMFARKPLFKKIEINGGFEGYLTLDWAGMMKDPKQGYLVKHFDGALLVGLGFSVKGTIVEQFTALYIPCYVALSLEFSMQTSIQAKASIITESTAVELPMKDTRFDFDVAAPVFNIALVGTLTLGIGVHDVCSAGASGVGTLQLYIAALSKKMIAEGHDVPHVVFGGKFVVEVFFQALCLKFSKVVWSKEKKRIWDSWPDPSSSELTGEEAFGEYEPRFRLRQPNGPLRHTAVYGIGGDGQPLLLAGVGDSIYENMQIVTEADDLIKTIEFEGEAIEGGIADESADYVRPEVKEDTSPAFIRQEDGSYKIELVSRKGAVTLVLPEKNEDADLKPQAEESEELEEAEELEVQDVQAETSQEAGEETQVEEVEGSDDTSLLEQEGLEALATSAVVGEVLEGEPVEGELVEVAADEEVAVEPMAVGDEAVADELPSSDVSEAAEPLVAPDPEAEVEAPAELEVSAEPEPEPEPEPELEAQAEPEPEPEHTLGESYWKNPGLGFAEPVTLESNYTSVANAEYPTPSYSIPESGVAGFAANGGITPTVDVVINNGVFSDPRQRVVTIAGVPYLFRILTVKLKTPDDKVVYRSRLAASKYKFDEQAWGTPKVINFTCDTGDLSRYKIFDYDFDLVVRPEGATWYRGSTVAILMTGGLRPYGDSSSVYDIFATPTITVLFLDANLNVVTRHVRRADAYLGSDLLHMVHCPHIVDRFTPDGSSGVFAFTFVHRSASNPMLLMTDDPSVKVAFTVGTCASLPDMKSFDPQVGVAQEISPTVCEVKMVVGKALGEIQQSVSLLMLYTQGYEVFTAYIKENESFSDIHYTKNITNTSDSLPGLVAWPGHSSFLYTRPSVGDDPNPHLYEGSFDLTASGASTLTEQRVDLEGFKGTAFGVSSSGNYIFCIENRDGWAGDEIDDATGKSTGSTTKTINRIKASKYVGGKFCEDFVFCELDHPVDTLEAMTLNGDANTFIASEIIDAEHSVARMHYIAVPHCFASTVESFRTLDDFALAGKPCTFKMTVRNHGNMIIRGFSVDFIDLDDHDKVIATVKVGEIKPSQIMVGIENYDWLKPGQESDEGAYHLSEALKDGALMPGAALTYPVTFPIPEAWGEKKPNEKHATRNVHLHIHDAWGEDYSLQVMDDGGGHRFVEPITNDMHFAAPLLGGTDGVLTLHVAEGKGNFYDPEERWEKNKKDDDHGGGGDSGGGGGRLPKTDDPYRPGTALGLALGGVGSLLMGYSARRLAVEQEEAEARGRK